MLAAERGIALILTIRFWFFELFVLALSTPAEGGLRAVAGFASAICETSRWIPISYGTTRTNGSRSCRIVI